MKFILTLFLTIFSLNSFAQNISAFKGSEGSLILPKGKPRATIILMSGGHGELGVQPNGEITRLTGNQMIRTRFNYAAQGFAVLALSSSGNLAQAVEEMRKIAQPVVVAGTSLAATRMHRGLNADAMVLTSAMLNFFQSNVGEAEKLPPTLIIHHREDGCFATKPALVDPFIAWSNGRAKAVWITGGLNEGDACEAAGYHGFAGLDGKIVGIISNFVKRTKTRKMASL